VRRRWLLAAPALAAVAPHSGMTATPSSPYLTPDSNLGDVLHHPAFAGFAPLLLPWDGRAYDEALSLRDVGTLLPYHSAVRPAVVVAAMNRMIDATAAGRAVFHRFYDDAAIRLDASKANTGLFFFRGRPGAPFAIICPGGGFAYVGSLHEGFPYGVEISAAGLNAFVLRYRAGMGGAVATEDLEAALAYVRRQVGTLDVGTEDFSLWGSSAGARMAASVGSGGRSGLAAVIMAYTAFAAYGRIEPPTFAVVGSQDGIAPPSSMEGRIAALRGQGVPTELRVIDGVGHGFGLGTGTQAEGWVVDAIRFWRQHFGAPGRCDP